MLTKTKGIVIGYLKYRDTSIIAKVFTRELGLKSYVVNGVRSAKSKQKMALYQPLTLVDLVVYDRENRDIHRISETQLDIAFQHIPFDFHRAGVALFMGETLNRALPENYQNEVLFDFLRETIIRLDQAETGLAVFPITYLTEMANYLGFGPADADEFFEQLPVDKAETNYQQKRHLLNTIIQGSSHAVAAPATVRRTLLEDLLIFYQIHLENFGEIKSLAVLRSLMAP